MASLTPETAARKRPGSPATHRVNRRPIAWSSENKELPLPAPGIRDRAVRASVPDKVGREMTEPNTNKRAATRTTAGETEPPLRGSREATLGATGLSKAIAPVPAHAPDDTRAPVYGASAPQPSSTPELRASREASLAGTAPPTAPGGGLAAEDEVLSYGACPGEPEPERDWARDAE